jgi:hypothetical protein
MRARRHYRDATCPQNRDFCCVDRFALAQVVRKWGMSTTQTEANISSRHVIALVLPDCCGVTQYGGCSHRLAESNEDTTRDSIARLLQRSMVVAVAQEDDSGTRRAMIVIKPLTNRDLRFQLPIYFRPQCSRLENMLTP